jgi:hypothetical protein
MILSRSLPAAAGLPVAEDRAVLRAGLRTMTELLETELLDTELLDDASRAQRQGSM